MSNWMQRTWSRITKLEHTAVSSARVITLAVLALSACEQSSSSEALAPADAGLAGDTGVIAPAADGGDGSATLGAEHEPTHESTDDYIVSTQQLVTISLNDSGIVVSDNAEGRVQVSASSVTISAPGTYRLSGKLSDGQVIVSSEAEGIVQLLLAGVDVTALSSDAALAILAADKAVIILEEGSDNRFADDDSYTGDASSEVNATLFSRANLSIFGSGSGTLHVRGNSNDAIASKAGLVIDRAKVFVDAAADDGIRGKSYLVVRDAALTISASGDGMTSDDDSASSLGYVEINGGSHVLDVGGDGIQAQTDLSISGGTFQITSAGGSGATLASDASAKGLKAGSLLGVYGGSFVLDTADDALHSNAQLLVEDGSFAISAGDDAVHAEARLIVNGGTFDITRSVEGIESAAITLNGGKLHVVASDDAVNVADGADANGRKIAASQLLINGAYLDVNSDGDGIDVNASITMLAGTVLVMGPTAQNNAPIDYDGSFDLKGGFLVAAGSAGMAQAPSASSTQPSLKITYGAATSGMMPGAGQPGRGAASSATMPAGTLIHVQTSDGVELLTFAPSKPWQSVVFSSDQLSSGLTGEIYTGGSCTGSSMAGLYAQASCVDRTLRTSFTLSSSVTNVNFQ